MGDGLLWARASGCAAHFARACGAGSRKERMCCSMDMVDLGFGAEMRDGGVQLSLACAGGH